MPNRPELITIKEAAEELAVSRGTVSNYVRKGYIKRYRIKATGKPVFKRADVIHLAENLATIVLDA